MLFRSLSPFLYTSNSSNLTFHSAEKSHLLVLSSLIASTVRTSVAALQHLSLPSLHMARHERERERERERRGRGGGERREREEGERGGGECWIVVTLSNSLSGVAATHDCDFMI